MMTCDQLFTKKKSELIKKSENEIYIDTIVRYFV